MRRVPPWLVVLTSLSFLLLHLPVLVLVAFSFNASRFSVEFTGLTLDWYGRLFARPDILAAVRRSCLVAGVSTTVATVFGTLLAMALARGVRRRAVPEALLYAPIVTPEIVVGIASLILFAAIDLPLGVGTIIIAHIAFSIPFVSVIVLARLRGMDETLEEAALLLGADELTTFRRVTLPQLWPGILAGALLAFTLSFDDFVITFFVSGVGSTTLPLLVYSMMRRTIEPSINAVSTVILVVTTLTIYLADQLGRVQPRSAIRIDR